jgi:uncharacterized protein YjbI with pentapeptide repeats
MAADECAEIRRLIDRARREVLVMTAAVQTGRDELTIMRAVARANLALDAAAHMFVRLPIHDAQHRALMEQSRQWAENRLADLEAAGGAFAWRRLQIADVATGSIDEVFDARGAMFRGVDFCDLDLRGALMQGTTCDACIFGDAALAAASFDDGIIDTCELREANLRHATFRRARIERSRLVRASLADATFDDATFTDCDLQGADLSASGATPATMRGALFVRCDLRASNWGGRGTPGVRFVECKLHGIVNAPTLDHADIVRADLSAEADGSAMVTGAEVLARWRA